MEIVWTAVNLTNVRTAFLANLVGRINKTDPAYSALVNELAHRYETER